jgi:hypothetical protein
VAAFARPHLCENGCRPMSKNQRVHHLGSDGRFGRTKRRLSRHLKYMACARIFEFESHHPGTQSVSWGPPKSPPVRSPPVTPPPPSGRVGRHSREADRFSGALTNPCQPMPKSRGRKPKKHRAPATAAPKKRLDTFSTTPQVSPLSTQPPQEPPPATAPRQEQPASKIKQIAKRMMSLWHWLRTTC